MSKLASAIECYNVQKLQDIARALAEDYREGTDMVYEAVLCRLAELMSESEYCTFCDSI